MSDSESETGVPLQEPLSPSTTPEAGTSRTLNKRKRAASEEPVLEDLSDSDAPAAATTAQTEGKRAAKKRKQKNKKPKDVAREEALDVELGVNHALKHMDGQMLADHIAQRMKKFEGDKLSGVEEDDLRIPGKQKEEVESKTKKTPAKVAQREEKDELTSPPTTTAIAIKDSTTWSRNRTLIELPTFLEEFSKPRRGTGKHAKRRLIHSSETPGSPHTIVISPSGIRAADVTRALRSFQTKDSFVAKLFAKHIKLKEAVELVQKTRMGIGVGTAQRVADLIEQGALKTEGLERLVVDVSHIDGKKRGILDMRETVAPLVRLFARPEFKERYGAEDPGKKTELVFF